MTRKLSKEEIKDKLDGEELDLSLCNLAKVPVREMASLPRATVVDLSCNNLTTLPDTFCALRHLVRLDLSKNALTELPKEFGNLTQLKRLDLYSNKLSDLPLSCVNLVSLRWLDLKNNPLQTLWPDVIGNCLREEECKECARNVLKHLKTLAENEEQANLRRLYFEREQKALEEEKEQRVRELRKILKQQEKKLKREAYEAMERQKKTMAEESDKVLKDEGQHIDSTMCLYCRQTPCITTDSREHLGFRAAHVQNHVRRRKDYKTYWRALKKCGLWQDPVYLARKVELGDRIDAVRERMPKCVVKNVRERFPNPLGIPYMGHKRD